MATRVSNELRAAEQAYQKALTEKLGDNRPGEAMLTLSETRELNSLYARLMGTLKGKDRLKFQRSADQWDVAGLGVMVTAVHGRIINALENDERSLFGRPLSRREKKEITELIAKAAGSLENPAYVKLFRAALESALKDTAMSTYSAPDGAVDPDTREKRKKLEDLVEVVSPANMNDAFERGSELRKAGVNVGKRK